jgi:hypothetical protein
MKDKKSDKRLILPRDEFEEEASEGLGKLNRQEAQEDLQELRDRLERRMRKPWMIWLTAAAAVIIILIASAVYVSLFRGPRMPGTRLARNEGVIRDTVLIAMAEPIVRLDTILIAMAEPIIRAEVAATRFEAASGTGLVASAVAVSMPERNKATLRSAIADASRLPVPVTGMDEFYLWIGKNIKSPVGAEPGVRYEVTVTFRVAADSTLYDMKAEKSPGDSFTREAFRLLREGPKWVPAVRDGRVIDEKATVSIVFR